MDKIRVLVAKLGLDIHWRGALSVAKLLRDAGMEVIYVGNQFPEAIVNMAIQEGVDVIGLSTLAGNHSTLGPKVIKLLQEKNINDITVVIGGVIPPVDIPGLKAAGMVEVFTPNTPIDTIVKLIKKAVREKKAASA
ncbi:MAG: methylmalonyl-CoA mutase [Peptococcaceae bacterium BRH_c4b]|nr:MAG: methylmalonyl-CoA mutase [Peptococcaceae bacterium BRH_c4b]